MILSILIPVYNYNCVALVKALQQQAENCNIDYEILVGDDGSDNAVTLSQNREINAIPTLTIMKWERITAVHG
jgi:hypothetical protein